MTMTLEEFKKAIHPASRNSSGWLIVCQMEGHQIRIMSYAGMEKSSTRPIFEWPVEIIAWVVKSIDSGILVESMEKVQTDCGLVTTFDFADSAEVTSIRH